MRNVHLVGALEQEFGALFSFDISTPKEAIEALSVNFPKFKNVLKTGAYHVIVGKTINDGIEMSEQNFADFNIGNQDLFIIPAIDGAKNGGLGKALLGIALLGLSAVTGGAAGALILRQRT